MGDFFKDLEEGKKDIHEIRNSTSKEELMAKYNEVIEKVGIKRVAKKADKTAEMLIEKTKEPVVKVQNLTKERQKEQSIDKDEIE